MLVIVEMTYIVVKVWFVTKVFKLVWCQIGIDALSNRNL
jgi:hypothetical protein